MPGIISPTGAVLADAQAALAQRRAELIGHAGELLGLVGGVGRPCFSKQGQDVGDRADVVRAGGQLDAALAGRARNGRRPAARPSARNWRRCGVFRSRRDSGQPIRSALIDS